jgi:dihydrofolate reductase
VRELVLKMHMSLDGFVGSLDGGHGWMAGNDPVARDWTVATISDASLHIMGSRTFRDMSGHWPTSTEVFAPPMNQIPKAVFTRRPGAELLAHARTAFGAASPAALQPGAESWAESYVASGDLATEIAKLKAADGEPIVAHGGAGFARSLVAQGLVDVFALMVLPVALGQGLPIFSALAAPLRLTLVSAEAFPSGATAQVYRAAESC